MKKIFGGAALALAGGIVAVLLVDIFRAPRIVERIVEQPPAAFAEYSPPTVAAQPVDLTTASARAVNSVVHVTTEFTTTHNDPFSQFFWGPGGHQQKSGGSGSGVIISSDGYIVTNNHVIESSDRIMVHLNDKRQFEAEVIGTDPSTDLALLKIEPEDIEPLAFGNSDQVQIGEWVLAVGNPFNLTSTVTAGIVSAKARNINLLQYDPSREVFPVESFIQTDAAVNPGNSGGALVSTTGQLLGINTAIASRTGSYAGYSFAVPVNIVKKVTTDLKEFGTVQRGYIGVSIRDLDHELAQELDMNDIKGVFVNGLTEGGAAYDAGLRKGDVILKVAGVSVNNVPSLQEQVSKFRPGNIVDVTVLRKKAQKTFKVTLRNLEGNTDLSEKRGTGDELLFGARLERASTEELGILDITSGVKVLQIQNGKLRSSGIREGFIITQIDKQSIEQPEDINRIITSKEGGVLIEGIYPNGMKAYYGYGI